MEDMHKDLEKKGKSRDFEHVVHFEFIVQRQAKKSMFTPTGLALLTLLSLLLNGMARPCPSKGCGSIRHYSTKVRKKAKFQQSGNGKLSSGLQLDGQEMKNTDSRGGRQSDRERSRPLQTPANGKEEPGRVGRPAAGGGTEPRQHRHPPDSSDPRSKIHIKGHKYTRELKLSPSKAAA